MIVRNIVYNTLLSISQVIFPLVTFPYATRILGPEKLGLVNFADAYSRYFMLVAALSLPLYGVRAIATAKKTKTDLSRTFFEILLIHTGTTLFFLALFGASLRIVPKLNDHLLLFLMGGVLIVSNIFSFEWFFAGLHEFKFVALRTLAIRLLFILAFFILVKSSDDYLLYFGLMVGSSVAAALVNMVYLRRFINSFRSVPKLNIMQHVKPIITLFGAVAAISVYAALDSVILGFSADDTSVGYYSSAMRINRIVISIIGSFSLVVYPQLSELHKQQVTEEYDRLVKNMVGFIGAICIPIVICMLAASDDIIELLAGRSFLPAVPTFQMLVFICLLVSLSNIFGNLILTSKQKDKEFLTAALCAGVVGLLLNAALAPRFKELGTALSSLAAETTMCLITFFYAKLLVPITFSLKVIYKHLVWSIPYVAVIIMTNHFIPDLGARLIVLTITLVPYFFVSQLFILNNEVLIGLYKQVQLKLGKAV